MRVSVDSHTGDLIRLESYPLDSCRLKGADESTDEQHADGITRGALRQALDRAEAGKNIANPSMSAYRN